MQRRPTEAASRSPRLVGQILVNVHKELIEFRIVQNGVIHGEATRCNSELQRDVPLYAVPSRFVANHAFGWESEASITYCDQKWGVIPSNIVRILRPMWNRT